MLDAVPPQGQAARHVTLGTGEFGLKLPGSLIATVERVPLRELPAEMQMLTASRMDSPSISVRFTTILSRVYGVANREWFLILIFDAQLKFWGWLTVSVGTRSMVLVDVPYVFQHVLMSGQTTFVVVHNHPSGSKRPSPEDLALTDALDRGAKLLHLQLLDHIIIAGDGYTSLRETGYLKA